MADPKRVAARYLAYSPMPFEQFGGYARYLVRPKSVRDLPTRERDKNDPQEQPPSDETSHLPDGEVQADDDPNDNQSLDTSRWPVQQSPNREKQRALPLPSGHPVQRTRSLVRPVVNVPDGQPGSRERSKTITPIRSPGTPGEDYGHPTKYDYNMPTRRHMTSEFKREALRRAIVQAGLTRLFPKKRQRRQTGPAKRYYQMRYRRKRNPVKRYMRRRYRKIRRKPMYKRDQRYREMYPRRYQRRPPGYRQNADRARDWREKHKVEERRRGVPQRKKREKERERRQKKFRKEHRAEEIWQFPVLLGDKMEPVLIRDFDGETGDVVYEVQATGEMYSVPFPDFLADAVVYEEDDIDWLLDLIEEEFGEDVWEYVDGRFDEEMSLEASWEDASWDLEDSWDEEFDDRLGGYVTFHRVQKKPENLTQNVEQRQDKGVPRKDPKRNDYTYGPPSPGGSKGKEPPTTWVGPMTSQPGIQTPSKDHKHPGQPHGNPDIDSGFPQPAVEEQSGSAKVIPDENRSTGDLSYRNKNRPTPSRGYKVGTGAQEAWVETGTGTLQPVEVLGYDQESQSTFVCDASVAAYVSGKRDVSQVPNSKVVWERDVSVKTADTIPMIRRRCERKIIDKSKGYSPEYLGFEAGRKVFKFKTGDWEQWVRVLPGPKSKAQNIINMEVRVRCSCPFHRWQGPEHWGVEHDYQYGKLQGTATFPEIRDPKFRHAACKHLVAVFDYIRANKLKLPEPVKKLGRYLLDTKENYGPCPRRVAARKNTI